MDREELTKICRFQIEKNPLVSMVYTKIGRASRVNPRSFDVGVPSSEANPNQVHSHIPVAAAFHLSGM